MPGRVPCGAEDRNGRVFHPREVAQGVADLRGTLVGSEFDRVDGRLRHDPGESVSAEGGVFVAVGVERPLAQVGIVDRYGDAVRGGEFVHELHIGVEPGRDRLLRIFRAVVRKRHEGPGDGEVALEQRDAVIGNGAFVARRRSRAAQSVCDRVAINGKSPLSFKFAFGEFVAAEQIAETEEFDISVEGASDSDRVFVAEDHHILPRHHVAGAEVRAAVDGEPHPGERPEVLVVRDRHRTRAGNDHVASAGVESALNADVAVEQRESAVDGEIPLARHHAARAGDEAAQRGNAGAAGEFSRGGDRRADIDLKQTVFAVFDPKPLAVPLDVDLGTVGKFHIAAEGHVQTGGDALDAAADGLEHQPGGAERHVEVADADGHAVQISVHDADGAAKLVA